MAPSTPFVPPSVTPAPTPGPNDAPDAAALTTRRRLLQAAGLTVAGAALMNSQRAAAGMSTATNSIPVINAGSVQGNKVVFPNWRGPADVEGPPPPAPLPPSERLGIAIVGLGRLSLEEILPAIAQSQKVRCVALVSGTPAKAMAVARQHGIAPEAIYSYENFERIADNPAIQAVYIVLPNFLHKEFTLRAARAGKHVLCEKPMATSSREAREMIEACRTAGRKLMIAYRCQYQPHNRQVIEMARDGSLGDLKLIYAVNTQSQGAPDQWRMHKAQAGGGALFDIGLYCLNGARAITGEEPVEIFARLVQPPDDPRFREVEATVDFTLRFPSGVLASLQTCYDAYDCKDLRLNLSRGSITLDDAFAYKGQSLHVGAKENNKEVKKTITVDAKNQFSLEMDHFADCVRENRIPRTPGEEGMQDHILMEAIYESARSGQPVRLAPVAGKDVYRGPALPPMAT